MKRDNRNKNKVHITVLQAGVSVSYFQHLLACFQYRDLLRMLSYRDLRVRYAQTFLGITWALINPVIAVLLLYFVFSIVAKVDTNGVPPLLFTMAGLCSWTYFTRVINDAGHSIVGAQILVKKVYFPRLIIPLSKVLSGLVDFVIVLILLFILILVYRIPFHTQMLMIFPFILLTILAGTGFGVWVAALSIRYRDFGQIVPVILRIGMFISPIAYGASLVPEKYRWIYNLNPLTGIIEGFRWSLFNTPLDPVSVWVSLIMVIVVLLSGFWYFFRLDQFIADII
ncbi:MAG: ABC transporter permease [Saprospiraceae bacterium]